MDDTRDPVRAALAALTPTVRDLARELGVSYASVHAWATCRRRPRAEHVERLADIMERRALEFGTLAHLLKLEARTRRSG
ncbi:MAG TPA: helix-turn-helix transcriptional regulator [Longimicrobiales bacterium]|nr:helix-turn-helix transcriptional regulator [Longimicrobiales bacterium]